MQIVGTHAVAQFSPIRDVCPMKKSSFRLIHNAKMLIMMITYTINIGFLVLMTWGHTHTHTDFFYIHDSLVFTYILCKIFTHISSKNC